MNELALGEICKFKYGKSLPARQRVPGRFPVYGSNGRVDSHEEAITDGPAIIVGRKGSVGQLHYSSKCCWPIDTTYYIDRECCEADLGWLYHALRSLRLHELNKATGVPGINRNDAYQRKLLVPETRKEQTRIANILDKAEDVRRKWEQALTMADGFVRSIFVDMFGTPLSNPKCLPTAPINALGRVVTGNTPPRKTPENYGDEIEWIKSDNINNRNYFLTSAEERLSVAGRRLGRTAPAGSTLVTCIAGSPNVIGNAALADREVAFNQQINAVIPNEQTDPYFLYCQFLVAKGLVQSNSTNSMKGMVSKGRLQEIRFLKPDRDEQIEFGKVFRRVAAMTRRLEYGRSQSEEMFGALSQRAFCGEL